MSEGPYRDGVEMARVKRETLEVVRRVLCDMEGEPPDGSDLSALVNTCRKLLKEADAFGAARNEEPSRLAACIPRHLLGECYFCDCETHRETAAALAGPASFRPTVPEGWRAEYGLGHSGVGWYAHVEEYPDEGSMFLGRTAEEATATAKTMPIEGVV